MRPFHFRREHHLTVLPLDRPASARRGRQRRSGSPTPIQPGLSFADLGVPAPVVTTLAEGGIIAPFPIQAATLTDTLAGRDVLGRGQTGSGKTLAFCIPLVAALADGYTMAGPAARPDPGPDPRAGQPGPGRPPAAGPRHGPELGDHLRRHPAAPAGGRAPGPRRHRRGLPGPPGRPDGAGPLPPGRRGSQRDRRGRPHGGPRVPAHRAQAADRHPVRGTADAVLGHPRQRR